MRPFAGSDSLAVLSWVRAPNELEAWASRPDFPLSPDAFVDWHADADVHPFVLELDGALAAYGEIWEDAEEQEAELARIIVAPETRGRGVGRRFVGLLANEARRRGFDQIWLRVVPGNAPALACYRGAGFQRAKSDEQARFNRGQTHAYVWMRFSG